MDHSFPLLSEGQVVELAANFMRDEVQTILFSMDPLKALRLAVSLHLSFKILGV